ncbi:hypothetical protein [Flexibacterium corallicola]|uniref:hypothetical protein n=1 Tax=Flexibacterium corallicola TaxID=3037259 RepID=UPI00286EE099|nr:hypothetical protein [Pseudovibrio sp. M1P-2-3]
MVRTILSALQMFMKALSGLFSYLERKDLKRLGAFEQHQRALRETQETLRAVDDVANEVSSLTEEERFRRAME